MEIMRVLVCGGRKYFNRGAIFSKLDLLNAECPIEWIIHGAATGADSLAGEWARSRGVLEERFPIEAGEGGFARNRRMLASSKPNLVVNFPGGNGTSHMTTIAREADVETSGGLDLEIRHQASLPNMINER